MSVEKARSHYLGQEGLKRTNCAQAVGCAFKDEYNLSDDVIESSKAYGGGRAPDGLCGAYYVAKLILEKDVIGKKNIIEEKDIIEKIGDFEKKFIEHAGSTKCHEIRQSKKLSCLGCVEKCSEYLEKEREK